VKVLREDSTENNKKTHCAAREMEKGDLYVYYAKREESTIVRVAKRGNLQNTNVCVCGKQREK